MWSIYVRSINGGGWQLEIEGFTSVDTALGAARRFEAHNPGWTASIVNVA